MRFEHLHHSTLSGFKIRALYLVVVVVLVLFKIRAKISDFRGSKGTIII